jgi:hypothetical protein
VLIRNGDHSASGIAPVAMDDEMANKAPLHCTRIETAGAVSTDGRELTASATRRNARGVRHSRPGQVSTVWTGTRQ